MKIMTRKSAENSAAKKGSASAPPQGAPITGLKSRPLDRHEMWIAAPIAFAILVAVGFGLLVANESAVDTSGASVTTFVGSEACAGCHQAQAALWSGSHHKRAREHAPDK